MRALDRIFMRRWRRLQSFEPDWGERQALMASFIPPGASVMDLGCGPMRLREHLHGGTYIGVDAVARGEGSVVVNLNRDSLPAIPVDWIVMSGVLEYLRDPARILREAAQLSQAIVLSYGVVSPNVSARQRRRWGWVNSFTREELLELVASAGLRLAHETAWQQQAILVAKPKPDPSVPGSLR